MEDLKTSESIQLKLEDTVNSFTKRIRCAVIDHISSMPAIVFPINAIKLFLDEKGIDLFVDGAHAMCQADIDIANLDC
jgi:selenocysteine lyase/cysteine desulfurase